METPALANDEYSATLRSTFIDGVDTTLNVTAIPTNTPTIVTVGWNTDYQTVFRVEGTSGTNSSNYALTGITKIKGYSGNLPENLALNCLNHEEYFNQWGEQIAAVQETAADAEAAAVPNQVSVVSSATPTPTGNYGRNELYITALAEAAELQAPSGTPANGNKLIVRILDDGTARALTYDAIYRGVGVDLPDTTVLSKTMYLGFIYNSADSKWDLVAVMQEE